MEGIEKIHYTQLVEGEWYVEISDSFVTKMVLFQYSHTEGDSIYDKDGNFYYTSIDTSSISRNTSPAPAFEIDDFLNFYKATEEDFIKFGVKRKKLMFHKYEDN